MGKSCQTFNFWYFCTTTENLVTKWRTSNRIQLRNCVRTNSPRLSPSIDRSSSCTYVRVRTRGEINLSLLLTSISLLLYTPWGPESILVGRHGNYLPIATSQLFILLKRRQWTGERSIWIPPWHLLTQLDKSIYQYTHQAEAEQLHPGCANPTN